MKMGDRLRLLREKKGLSQKDMAQTIGVSDRVYSYYEQDRFPKDEEIIKKMAKTLGTTVSYLLGEDSIEKTQFAVLARSAENLSEDDQSQLYQIFEATLNTFLNKGNQTKNK